MEFGDTLRNSRSVAFFAPHRPEQPRRCPHGNRTSLRKRDGSTLTYQYDALNRLTRKTVPDRAGLDAVHERDVFYAYDLRNLQLHARFDSATGEGVTNVYDAFGRLTSSSVNLNGTTRTLAHQYDRNSNRTRITYPDGHWFQQNYDQLNRPTLLSYQGAGGIVSIARAPHGAPVSISRGNNSSAALAYDGVQRLAGIANNYSAGNVGWTYGRNAAGQLSSVARDNDAYAWTGHYAVNRPYTTDGLNRYTAAGGASFVYDANGNLTSDGTRTFAYDVENRLVGATGGLVLSYDPLGRLYQSSGGLSGTTRYLYDGDALIAEYNSTGTMLRRHVHSVGADVPVLSYEGPGLLQFRYLFPDHQGSIVALTDPYGTPTPNRYDEYGIPAGTNTGRFQYTGQIWLPDLGMYHYKARVYSPYLGRFLQTDPVGYGDQFNLYAYVGNDPLNLSDPSGECTVTKQTADFCNKLEESGREGNLVPPTNTPITVDRGFEVARQAGFSIPGPGVTSVVAGKLPAIDIPSVISARNAALGDQASEFPGGKEPLRGDAFRHANLSIRLERSIGDENAQLVQDAYERSNPNSPGESLMDVVNNHNGRELSRIFPDMSPRDLARMALIADLLQTRPYRIVP